MLKLGSLFDGIGAFPYAASFLGIKTIWASEILPAAISVTRRHFSEMEHVGDITKLDGTRLAPVDIIAFGSPCQDLSQAAGGNRAGLAGERSGLFMEAIRIIREMRCATNGQYPRYAIFENVPGCFSSNGRRDYKAVLEAFTESSIPMPESMRWRNAGLVRCAAANIAWCVYDAQHFGLAQRRKRLFLIADFGKGCPKEILLVPKSLPGHFAQSCASRQRAAATAESGAGGAESTVYGICSFASNSMKSANPHSGFYEADTSRTLDLNCGNPSCNQGGMAVVSCNGKAIVLNDQGGRSLRVEKNGCAPTLRCNTHGNLPIACMEDRELPPVTMRMRSGCEGGGKGPLLQTERSGTLATGNDQYLFCAATAQSNAEICDTLSPTIPAAAGTSGNNKPHVAHPGIVGTLCASAAGLSRPGGMASETDLAVAHATFSRQRSDMFQSDAIASTQTAQQHKDATDLCVSYCLQGTMIDRDDCNGLAGSGGNENISFTLNEDRHAVAVDCRNLKEVGEISGALQAKGTAGYSLNYQNPVRDGYVVRRLTPTECERLMGFPVGWTACGHDGKDISDNRRYSMLGNSIATPCAAYILQGICEQYARGKQIGS